MACDVAPFENADVGSPAEKEGRRVLILDQPKPPLPVQPRALHELHQPVAGEELARLGVVFLGRLSDQDFQIDADR